MTNETLPDGTSLRDYLIAIAMESYTRGAIDALTTLGEMGLEMTLEGQDVSDTLIPELLRTFPVQLQAAEVVRKVV